MKPLITDDQTLTGAKYRSGYSIPVYDDGFGQLYISRNSIGINGIVRAQSWEDAYGICEDEFFSEADETIEELIKEYGFKREHKKVIRAPGHGADATTRDDHLAIGEKYAELSDYTDNGRLPDGLFIRWETIETPDADAWSENELFCEAYGFRPNGPNARDKHKHGIYAKDLNGDSLDPLTPELLAHLEIELQVEDNEQ